ncbi:hypothetical protein E1B28_000150 [Marasmius oreades]|uniref:Uncharacterized protein n=1 Tax=Marasmius oreades TaxID=181124 RepID=A0A9P7V0V1_9AGAR|nr:uncharacterized protein E1B28_000150 [Marasmius oreades]KAG7098182.1 hypothetical protein E1B28_000150 [Marasmius oreades]
MLTPQSPLGVSRFSIAKVIFGDLWTTHLAMSTSMPKRQELLGSVSDRNLVSHSQGGYDKLCVAKHLQDAAQDTTAVIMAWQCKLDRAMAF